jgi:ubiquitin
MKLTEENADYQDSRPRTGRSNLSKEFQEKMAKRLAEREVAASPEVSKATTHRRSRRRSQAARHGWWQRRWRQ